MITSSSLLAVEFTDNPEVQSQMLILSFNQSDIKEISKEDCISSFKI